jgi:hypothetical protein
MERKADIELAPEQTAWDLSAEGLAGDDGQVRAVVLQTAVRIAPSVS